MSISFSTATNAQVQDPFIDQKKSLKPICTVAFGNTELLESSGEEFHNKNARIVDHQWESVSSDIHRGYITIEFYLEEHHLTSDLGLYMSHHSVEISIHSSNYEGALRMKVNGRTFYEIHKQKNPDGISDEPIDLSSLVNERILHPGINTLHIELANTASPIHKITIAKS